MIRRRSGLSLLSALAFLLSGCGLAGPAPTATLATPSLTPPPTATATPSPSPFPSPTLRAFPTPRVTAATPIPPPARPIDLPGEARVLLLAGLDQPNPYNGRTDAILLVLYHPRLAKAALISIPPDLYGYLPGWTMQRFSSAYSLGGAPLLIDTLDYNLGLRPQDHLVANLDDFAILVDELGGLDVPVLEVFPRACGEIIYPGHVFMNGEQALCYATLREGMKEAPRGLRQQMLLRLVLERFLADGNLRRLPELYRLFRPRLDTSLTALDVAEAIPLALRFGDPERTAYFQVGPDHTRVWQVNARPPAEVFLPQPAALRALLQQAVDFISQPSPMSDLVLTLEYELTATVGPSQDLPGEPSGGAPTPGVWSDTPTLSQNTPVQPSITPTPTETFTPTLTETPTPTVTPTASPAP